MLLNLLLILLYMRINGCHGMLISVSKPSLYRIISKIKFYNKDGKLLQGSLTIFCIYMPTYFPSTLCSYIIY